jgi:hypothetical protein
MSTTRVFVLMLMAMFAISCDAPGILSSNQSNLSVSAPDIGVFPGSAASLTLSVELGPFHPLLPIGLQITVKNVTASSLELPLLLLGGGLLKISVVTPSGDVLAPPGQGSRDYGGKLIRTLGPGDSMTEVVTLGMRSGGDYLFREAGTYTVIVSYSAGITASTTIEVQANTDPSDLASEKLLDDDEVRSMFYFELGFHRKTALANLGKVLALMPPSPAYKGYARYALGLAYARSGLAPCDMSVGSAAKSMAGETYLSGSFSDLPTLYLKKRAAYWLARCAKTKGDAAAYASYRAIYSAIPHAFPSYEEAALK